MLNTVESYQDLVNLAPSENEYYFYGREDYNPAWKLHLCINPQPDVSPKLNDPFIRDISKYLIDKQIEHKYGNGGDGYKTYTIYTGTPEDTWATASKLKQRFKFPETGKRLERSDLYLDKGIYARFEGQPYRVPNVHLTDSMFMHYGLDGIPMLNRNITFDPSLSPKLNKQNKTLLHALCGHVFCAKHYGQNYLGRHYNDLKWDSGLFNELSDTLSLDEIERYIDKASRFPLPHVLANNILAPAIILDIAGLTGANNKPKSSYGINTDSIIAKMQNPTDSILTRYDRLMEIEKADAMIKAISAKWRPAP